ncbi:tyrosyl-tRNA deacylase [Oceanospirillum sediminis]|uniref:Tyrosyl-tRNA deacylase n=1 Tax=Oceanospirillum sediminis TaxID=2760088 RepID=A0A839IUT5_9GAMM|nr:tyrosyl-tRNA deacylase [Oceanospirillum sediminis]MBB1489213.1 tyrosyl-tRNA deacylase [Oceanospirillum sediminis]
MSEEKQIISIEFDVNKRIDQNVEKILKEEPITLPDVGNPLVKDYIRKIEGTYDVSRSKEDTDNAIDLLYIAYNTTPQSRGLIRSEIDDLMARLVKAQQESERQMRKALSDASTILSDLPGTFEDWNIARNSKDIEELKYFIGQDLKDQAEDIQGRAKKISDNLTAIAETYDGIISDTTKTVHKSEKALAEDLADKSKIEDEINRNNAQREKLQKLVDDLKADITKYENMAKEYKSQAETAEKRAFIMSIVRVGAQMISAAIPAITAGITGAATGGASLVAASATNTARQLVNTETAATDDDKTAEVIQTKKDIADKKSEKTTAEREKAELEEKGKTLKQEKEKVEADESLDAETKEVKVAAVEKRIEDNDAKIKKKEAVISAATTALNALNESLKSLSENMDKMTEKQEEQAKNLRDLQMQMLKRVEAYETEKRNQAAELVKITALLKGQRTKEETIELAIKSLNLSLKALKRMREIVVEISFFFKSFADFMTLVMENADRQAAIIQKAIGRDRLTRSFTNRLKRNTDDFFVTQMAEWQAIELVSAKFVDNFNDGWSKLNKLSGNYLTGDELKAYLNVAANRIDEISFRRKQASIDKLAELNRYRDLIQSEA